MSDIHDPLEAELAALQPHELSLKLKHRIASDLAATGPVRTGRRWAVRVTCGVVAAGIGLAILLVRVNQSSNTRHPLLQPLVASEVRHVLPTLKIYQQALNESPEALDALLAKHAALAPMAHPHLGNIDVLTRSDSDLRTLTGDF